jgi:hypothetical protein
VEKLDSKIVLDQAIVSIEPVKSTRATQPDSQEYDVVVVCKDGSMTCLDDRLQSTRWTSSIFTGLPTTRKTPETQTVLHCFMTTAASIKHILAHRPEVLGWLQGYNDQDDATLEHINLVVAICARNSELASEVIISAVYPRKTPSNLDSPLKNLIFWSIPKLPFSNITREELVWSLNLPAGLLHAAGPGCLVTLRFSKQAAIISSVINEPLTSGTHLPISQSSVLTTARFGYTVFDFKFNTIQDQRALETTKKRKRGIQSSPPHHPVFIDYFLKSKTVVAVQGFDILSIHLDVGSSKRKSGTITLADSIGKGIFTTVGDTSATVTGVDSEDECLLPPPLDFVNKWHTTEEKFLELISFNQFRAFDRLFAHEVGHHVKRVDKIIIEWTFNERDREKSSSSHRDKALFALRGFFKREMPRSTASSYRMAIDATLKLQFFTPNVFHWLIWTGQLTRDLVQQALSQTAEAAQFPSPISRADLISAIANFDTTLGLLKKFVDVNQSLDLHDYVHVVKFLVRSPDETEIRSLSDLLLTNGTTNHDDQEMSGTTEVDSIINDETTSALQAIDMAMGNLEGDNNNRELVFHTSLIKTNSYPQQSIVDAFQETLNRQELLALIQILKSQLTGGGWTSFYLDNIQGEFENSINDVTIISRLLSCAIDAIGINGFLSTATSSNPGDNTDVLVDSLAEEVVAASEGIHEAKFMEAAIDGFLRYSFQVDKAQKDSTTKLFRSALTTPLPLGLKPEVLQLTKTSYGGVVTERSKRDIGAQMSKKLGKYTFERIRL